MPGNGPFRTQQPASDQPNAYLPAGPVEPLLFEKFEGMNTQTTRSGVDDKQCWWIDGFMPIGPRFLRTLYDVGTAIFTAASPNSISFFDFGNISATPYCIAIYNDGSVHAINTDTLTATMIAPAGTLASPSQQSTGMSQWGNTYIMLVCDQDDGYFIWDGTLWYAPGTLGPTVTITSGGSGYATAPSISASGGSGSGATFTATVSGGVVTEIAMTNPGSGWLAGESVQLLFSGGSPTAGTVTSIGILDGGTNYSSPSLTISGGGGTGATATATVASGVITGVSVTGAGSGFTGTPTVAISDSSGSGAVLQVFVDTVASATVELMPFAIGGTAIEVYSGRVWIANGAVISYTAPGSVSDFSSANGGGNFTSSDSFLRVAYTELKQTNGFLYLLGDSSINYISGVSTSGTPPVTTFTNQNADPEVGTPWPATVDTFGRNIVFANAFGAHISYGAAVTKISNELDGVYNSVPNFAGFSPSAAKAILFARRCWVLLLPIIDPVSGQQVNKLLIWDGKHWWASEQSVALTYIQHQEINSVLTAYGTDGTSIYPLFTTPSSSITKTVQSKLWTKSYLELLQTTTRVWGAVQYYSDTATAISLSVDNENEAATDTVSLDPSGMVWETASGATMAWTDAGGDPMTWLASGSSASGVAIFPPTTLTQNGVMLGLTLQTDCPDMALIMLAADIKLPEFRG